MVGKFDPNRQCICISRVFGSTDRPVVQPPVPRLKEEEKGEELALWILECVVLVVCTWRKGSGIPVVGNKYTEVDGTSAVDVLVTARR